MDKALWVGAGGFIGSVLRYVIAGLVQAARDIHHQGAVGEHRTRKGRLDESRDHIAEHGADESARADPE